MAKPEPTSPILTVDDMDLIINHATKLTNPMPLLEVMNFGDAVRDAQAKKIAEWGDEICPHYVFPEAYKKRRQCPECWAELKKEAGK